MKREYLNSISELRTVATATRPSQIAAAFGRVILEYVNFLCAVLRWRGHRSPHLSSAMSLVVEKISITLTTVKE